MIRVKCPKCKRVIEVEVPGLYTCRACKQVLRIEGRVQDRSILHPFVLSAPIPTMGVGGKLDQLASSYLETYSKFAQATGWTQ